MHFKYVYFQLPSRCRSKNAKHADTHSTREDTERSLGVAPSQGEVRLPYLFQTILRWVVTGSSPFEEAPGMVFVPTSLGARADLVGYPCRPHGIFVPTSLGFRAVLLVFVRTPLIYPV